MITLQLPEYTEEEALGRILSYLRNPARASDPFSPGSSYDLYIPDVVTECIRKEIRTGAAGTFQLDPDTNAAPFYDAAWSLCTRGILRPGIVQPQRQFEYAPIIGAGYYLTPYGKQWLARISGYETIPSEYGRFSQLLAVHSKRFGDGYHIRSQEAVNCYRAHTYLACCVMCGAAAESILLALAIAKTADEAQVLRDYMTNTGRTKIENKLLAHANSHIQQELRNYTDLLKYWRDAAAHGADTSISEGEAFTSLLLLLRFAQFADDRWGDLTT